MTGCPRFKKKRVILCFGRQDAALHLTSDCSSCYGVGSTSEIFRYHKTAAKSHSTGFEACLETKKF